jgi:hypothetical protein
VKVCISSHELPEFGVIPAGSLWDDESPYVVEADCFADVGDEPEPKPKKGSR